METVKGFFRYGRTLLTLKVAIFRLHKQQCRIRALEVLGSNPVPAIDKKWFADAFLPTKATLKGMHVCNNLTEN